MNITGKSVCCCAQSSLQCCHRAYFRAAEHRTSYEGFVGDQTLEDHVEFRSFFRCTTTKKMITPSMDSEDY